MLGDKPFLFGDSPYVVDASVFGILDIILYHKGAMPQLEALVGLQGQWKVQLCLLWRGACMEVSIGKTLAGN